MLERLAQAARARAAAALLGGMLALPAAAAPDTLTEQAFIGELPVVLSASRLHQPQSEAPGSVTVIDRELIKLSGARDLADLLRLVPGFLAAHADDATPAVTYHGLGDNYSRHMQLLIDGRATYSTNLLGGIPWNQLAVALEDIERIEVVRGSNAAAYGGNAFLGVINVITLHPTQTQGVYAAARLGNTGIRDNLLRYAGRLGGMDMRVTVGRQADSGFEGIPDDKRVGFLSFRGELRSSATDTLDVHLSTSGNSAGAGFEGLPNNPPRVQHNGANSLQLRWQSVRAPDEEFSLQYYFANDSIGEIVPFRLVVSGVPVSRDIDTRKRSWRHSLEAQHTTGLGQELRLVWGGELRHDAVRSQVNFHSDETFSASLGRLFGNLEWRARPTLVVNAAAMLEHYSLTGTHLTPRLSANWHVVPGHTLRVGASVATRMPTLYEDRGNQRLVVIPGFFEVVNFVGTGGLEPERVMAREIGYLGEWRRWRASLDVRAFHEKVGGLILPVARPVPGRTFRNAASATIRGIEYQLRATPLDGALAVLSQAFVRIGSEDAALPLTAPSRTTSLLLAYRLGSGTQLSLTHHDVGAQRWIGQTFGVPAYRRLDWRIAQTLALGATRAEVAVTVQNQFAPYEEFRPEYRFRRRGFVSLALEF